MRDVSSSLIPMMSLLVSRAFKEDHWCPIIGARRDLCSRVIPPWDFAGGPVVKTACSHCRGHCLAPWSGK